MAKKRMAKVKVQNDARAGGFIKSIILRQLRLLPCPGMDYRSQLQVERNTRFEIWAATLTGWVGRLLVHGSRVER